MKRNRDFKMQLDNLGREADVIAQYVYAEMTMHQCAHSSKKLLSKIQETPRFWNTCVAALQNSAYIALSRVFEIKSPYNLNEFIESLKSQQHLFSQSSLASRKTADGLSHVRAQSYAIDAHELDLRDIARLEKLACKYRALYERTIMPARHNHIAHRQIVDGKQVQNLFGRGNIDDLWRLTVFV